MNKIIKVLLALILIFVIIVIAMLIDYNIECKNKKWDTGVIKFNGTEITLPIGIEEFEEKTKISIDRNKIKGSFIYIDLNEIETEETKADYLGTIQLYIKEDIIKGIKVSSYTVKKSHDEFVGKIVKFPEMTNTNQSSKEFKDTYKTGFINFFIRINIEKQISQNTSKGYDFWFENTLIKYTGNFYDIEIEESIHANTEGDKLETTRTIFYYAR